MKRFLAVFLAVWVLLGVGTAFADGKPLTPPSPNQDILPGGAPQSPLYKQYPPEYYILDYVPEEDPGPIDSITQSFYEAINWYINLAWQYYIGVIDFTIRFVAWAFNNQIITHMIQLLSVILDVMNSAIFQTLWYLGAAIAIVASIYLWATGQTIQSIKNLIGMIALIAFTPVILNLLPLWMQKVNDFSAGASSLVLDTAVSKAMERNGGNPTQAKGLASVQDSLWRALVVQPYMIVEFGSVKAGEKYFADLMKNGADKKARIEWFRGHNKENVEYIDDQGKARRSEFVLSTQDGLGYRVYNLVVASILPLLVVLLLVAYGIVILYRACLSVGYASLVPAPLLFSYWRGFGLDGSYRWIYKTLMNLLMKLFYTMALAVFLVMWMELGNPQRFADINLGERYLLVILFMVGLWIAVRDLRHEVSNIQGLSGQTYSLDGHGTKHHDEKILKNTVTAPAKAVKTVADFSLSALLKRRAANMMAGKTAQAVAAGLAAQNQQQTDNQSVRSLPLQTTLSRNARDVFTKMSQRGYDPTNQADREAWADHHPDHQEELNEIAAWSKMPLAKQLTHLPQLHGLTPPPPPPAPHTPEFRIWQQRYQKDRMIYDQAKKEVNARYAAQYKQQLAERSVIQKMLGKRPQRPEPTVQDYLQRYRQLKQKLEGQNKSS